MTDTKEETRVDAAPPMYRLLAPFYADDVYIESEVMGRNGLEATVIEFEGEPNESMEPLNEAARTRMRAFLQKLAEGNRRAGFTGNRTPSMGDIAEKAMNDRPREMPVHPGALPPMPNTAYEGAKFRQQGEHIPAVKVVEQENPISLRPRKVMGTIIKEESIHNGPGGST